MKNVVNDFALRAALAIAFAVGLCGGSPPARADKADAAVAAIYDVRDVAVNVDAASAGGAPARDAAIAKAQREAFVQLLGRLGADAAIAERHDDNAVSALVKSFDVQKENASPARYIGTFAVRFRPASVRKILSDTGASYDESRANPILVLPVSVDAKGRPILWEERTLWRDAWEAEAKRYGAVPLMLPSGDIEDASVISAAEAVGGSQQQLQEIADRYQASGVMVAVLNADLAHPEKKQEMAVELRRSDINGKEWPITKLALPATEGDKAMAAALSDAVRMARGEVEGEWRKAGASPRAAAAHVKAVVDVETPSEWADLRERLSSMDGVSRLNVLALRRGAANIELEFRGGLEQLREAITEEGLEMQISRSTGGWVITGGRERR